VVKESFFPLLMSSKNILKKISRRDFFIKSLGGSLLGILGFSRFVSSSTSPEVERTVGVLVDLTRCIGCRACENACITRQGHPSLPEGTFGFGPGEEKLSYRTWTYVDFPEVGENGRAGQTTPVKRNGYTVYTLPVKKQCMHCMDPACVSVCPVAALEKTPKGPVIYREDRCIGCRYCLLACPFDIPKFEWDSGIFPRVGKCDLCSDRVVSGLKPACVNACPTGTLKFGKRSKVLWEARARMNA
jgi:formate dehydrogenase iron-sulfur subunit